jgi:hypothetical protein
LAGNPAAESVVYRPDVLETVPQLIYLDEKRLRGRKKKKQITVVTILLLPFVKIEKGQKYGEKPKSTEGLESRCSDY